jgi:ATP-dependent helicase/nuclease subunit A
VPGGARDDVRRTLFAVGDEKQSIFSFQGAVPLEFAQMRKHFEKLFSDTEMVFREERLEYSFRSAPGVLEAVDAVFSHQRAFDGLSHDAVKTVHQAVHEKAPSEVEIWDLIAPGAKGDKEAWNAPFDTKSETSPAIKLAAKIGRTVKAWTARGTSPRDVLILVRQRGPLFEAVIRALKHEAVAVAGADRLILTEHIAVMDLLVLGDALLLPGDDLALATVLKSPLFGLNEDQLYRLAFARKDSLRRELRAKANDDPMFAAAAKALTNSPTRRGKCRRLRFTRMCSARATAASAFSRGSASRPRIRSMNSSTSRWTMSGARRRRCKASSTGSVPRKTRSSATWKWAATRCG